MSKPYTNRIVNETDGKPRYNLVDRAGNIVAQDVCIDLSSPVTQAGDKVGAAELNLLIDRADNGTLTFKTSNIMSSGTNSYGSYMKFADGTMIQWGKQTNTVQTGGKYPFVFPVAFIDTNIVCTTSFDASISSSLVVTRVDVTTARIYFKFTLSTSGATIGDGIVQNGWFVAIGRWKA